jgi:hypothetical protein
VYRAIWKGLEVAVKTVVFQDRLDALGGGESEHVARIFEEVAIAANMSHPHIVNTFSHELKQMPSAHPGELVDYKLYLIQARLFFSSF